VSEFFFGIGSLAVLDKGLLNGLLLLLCKRKSHICT